MTTASVVSLILSRVAKLDIRDPVVFLLRARRRRLVMNVVTTRDNTPEFLHPLQDVNADLSLSPLVADLDEAISAAVLIFILLQTTPASETSLSANVIAPLCFDNARDRINSQVTTTQANQDVTISHPASLLFFPVGELRSVLTTRRPLPAALQTLEIVRVLATLEIHPSQLFLLESAQAVTVGGLPVHF